MNPDLMQSNPMWLLVAAGVAWVSWGIGAMRRRRRG